MSACDTAPYTCTLYRQPGMYFSRLNPDERYRGSYLFAMDPFYSPLNWQTQECLADRRPGNSLNNPLGPIKPLQDYSAAYLVRQLARTRSSGSY